MPPKQGQEYGLFEAERQRLANPQLAAETTVDLNVGGTLVGASGRRSFSFFFFFWGGGGAVRVHEVLSL